MVVLISLSLLNRDVNHCFRCSLAISTSSLEYCLSRSFAHFPLGLLVLFCSWVVSVSGRAGNFEIWIKCLHVVYGRGSNGDILVSGCAHPCVFSKKRSAETASFPFHGSLLCSLCTHGLKTGSVAEFR